MPVECKIVFHAVPAGPAFGPMAAQGHCETHGIQVPSPYTVGLLCPLGRIEKAVEDGIARIKDAADAR